MDTSTKADHYRLVPATAAALAGRRIDVPNSRRTQFPEANIETVRSGLTSALRIHQVGLLACSAACGADLIALQAAVEAGIRCRVVLPFSVKRFRQTSVVDRPGNWGALFDRLIDDVERAGDLIVLKAAGDDAAAYYRANEAIVREIVDTPALKKLAIVVWEGRPRGSNDATEQFRRLARAASMTELIVKTS